MPKELIELNRLTTDEGNEPAEGMPFFGELGDKRPGFDTVGGGFGGNVEGDMEHRHCQSIFLSDGMALVLGKKARHLRQKNLLRRGIETKAGTDERERHHPRVKIRVVDSRWPIAPDHAQRVQVGLMAFVGFLVVDPATEDVEQELLNIVCIADADELGVVGTQHDIVGTVVVERDVQTIGEELDREREPKAVFLHEDLLHLGLGRLELAFADDHIGN